MQQAWKQRCNAGRNAIVLKQLFQPSYQLPSHRLLLGVLADKNTVVVVFVFVVSCLGFCCRTNDFVSFDLSLQPRLDGCVDVALRHSPPTGGSQ